MDIVFILTLFLGLVFGSFLTAFTYRFERGIDFIWGRSNCDTCNKNLFWYDNLPLLSYIFYRGKSRCCNKKISIRYPLIELFTASGFVILYTLGFSFVYYFVFLITFAILIIDMETMTIPDELIWVLMIVSFLVFSGSLYSNLLSGFLGAIVFLVLHMVTRGNGMGLGDVKLALALGFLLTLQNLVNWFMAAFILGGIVSVFLLLFKRVGLRTKIAFGPFMIVAFWIIMFIG